MDENSKKALSATFKIIAGLVIFIDIILGIVALSEGGVASAIIFLAAGAFLLPIPVVRNFFAKYLKKAGLPIRIGASVIVWLVAACLFPASTTTEIEAPIEVVEEVEETASIEDDSITTKLETEEDDVEVTSTETPTTAKKTAIEKNEKSATNSSDNSNSSNSSSTAVATSELPVYSGSAYTVINNNVPGFSASDMTRTDAFETYSSLDSLGRCGVAYANICKEIMPTSERGAIGSVRPSGWHTVKYNGVVDGNYLYNRCHLIGYQLSGENANNKNLITGTRYLNVEGMLPFENMVDDYVDETNNHVLYRVTPVFEGDNLVASGVQMEAYSVEDSGAGISFNVYCYNVQPGITIDYATGDSALSGEEITKSADNSTSKSKNNSGSATKKSSESDSSTNTSTASSETNNEASTTAPAAPEEASPTTEPTPTPVTEGAYVVNTNNGTLHKASCGHGPEPQNSASYADLESAKAASEAINGSVKYCGHCMKEYKN